MPLKANCHGMFFAMFSFIVDSDSLENRQDIGIDAWWFQAY